MVGREKRFPVERTRRVIYHNGPMRRLSTRCLLILQLSQEVKKGKSRPLAFTQVGPGFVAAAASVRFPVFRHRNAEVIFAVDPAKVTSEGVSHVFSGELCLADLVQATFC
ncbi:hypothetical protein BN381_600028 [Candidatus Microthrix parvicella RN1]|uniref:Uncharacterized protein n=1 Tax=Candidatus Neomicrothrix parvicella RN1 TaxID=1229780 RepID=R4Z2Q3_9ACTN|nr:hypothetical protein BN381_600028 [Candidatus Microthrix parvicella RN1]